MKRLTLLAAALAAAFHVQAQVAKPAQPSASATSASVAAPPPSVEAGRRAYTSTCARCHGINLVASSSAFFDLRTFPKDEKERFLQSVINGKRQMPAWGGIIKPETIESIWLYVGSVNGW